MLDLILNQFAIQSGKYTIKPHKLGHINSTYLVFEHEHAEPLYVLQKINTHVFANVPQLMSNIKKVLQHLKSRLKNSSHMVSIVPTRDNTDYIIAGSEFWRLYTYAKNTITKNICNSTEEAFQAGKIAGSYQVLVNDLKASEFYESIPNFHNSKLRLEALNQVLKHASTERISETKSLLDYIDANKSLLNLLVDLIAEKKVPMRIIHGDLKFNNVLFDKTSNQAVGLVDFDTYMPGSIIYDFGDFVRSVCATAPEDETNLEKIGFNLEYFKALTAGFLSELGTMLEAQEKANFVIAPRLIALTLSLRFLTDYLANDVYFKIERPKHNLDRALSQLTLAKRIEEVEVDIRKVIK